MTGTRGLLDWLDEADPIRGVEFLDADGTWQLHTYRALAGRVLGQAARLRAARTPVGCPVAIVADSGVEFVSAFFGALASGCTPVPIPPPAPFQGDFAGRLRHRLRAAGVQLILVQHRHADSVRAAVEGAAPALLEIDETVTEDGRAELPDRALIQFTSGSSGSPRGIAVSASALAANLAGIARWLDMTPDDLTATWLPLHHDMGLVGCLLTPIVYGSRVRVLQPQEFIRRPELWLDCFGSGNATLSAAPNFGLAHVLRRLGPDRIAGRGWNFDGWRSLIVGSERIEPQVLRDFAALLEPYGFAERTCCPAYGLAEATLAVTGGRLRATPRIRTVDRRRLAVGQRLHEPAEAGDALELVGCGRPIVAGSEVQLRDHDGQVLPVGSVGEIAVRGDSVAEARLSPDEPPSDLDGGWLLTGDCGFLDDGELFVLGRLGDSIKRRGLTIFAEDIEALIGTVPGLERERPAVLLGSRDGADHAVIVVERAAGEWAIEVAELVRRRVADLGVVVVAGSKGTVERTTSGKPRRRVLWQAFERGELTGTVCHQSPVMVKDG
jgi:acyl-CoA synthetase (AMP-forming)/AMP-acid ligase II